jgi:hypothetical protein
MAEFHIPQDAIPISSLKPAADAAGRTGTYASLKNALMAFAVFYLNQANAATIACDVLQAQAVAGTNAKALSINAPIFTDLDADTSSVMARQTDAKTYTTDAATKTKVVIIQVDPAQLDAAGGFDCIAMRTGASNAANITSGAIYVVPRYTGTVANQPNYLVD